MLRHVLSLFVIVLASLALAGPRLAGATSCVVLPETREAPAYVSEARAAMTLDQPERAAGYEALAEQLRKNREEFAAGRIDAREAAARGGFVVEGNRTIPVLPVLYTDTGGIPFPVNVLQSQLFDVGTGTSMTDYFVENSYDKLHVTGTVFNWERLSGNDFDYTGFTSGLNGGGAVMAWEAATLFDATVDFSQFDNDGPDGVPNSGDDDGIADLIVIVQPERGAECTSNFHDMWSHHHYISRSFDFMYPTNDPSAEGGTIWVDRYVVVPSQECNGMVVNIGVFCHEYGHALGLPDFYDTVSGDFYGDNDGIGWWGLMGSGNQNSPSSPAHMTAFSKYQLGWLDYFDVLQDGQLCLPPVETNPVAARVWKDGRYGTEFFLIENRQDIGFDASIESPGVVIYHVDQHRYVQRKDTNRINTDETHKAIDVECPDAVGPGHIIDRDDLDVRGDGNRADAGDVWCAGGFDSVFDSSSPSDSRALNDTQTGVRVKVLDACTGDEARWICTEITVGVPQPVDLCIPDCEDGDCGDLAHCDEYWVSPNIWIDNEENGFQSPPSPGIPNKLWFEVQNLGPEVAAQAEVSMYMAPAGVGLEWPQDAQIHVGTMSVPVLDVGQTFREHFVQLYPLLLEPDSHWCIGTIASHPQDLSTGTQAWQSNNLAQVNEQVLYARAGSPVRPGRSDGNDACPGPMTQASKIYLHDGYNPMQKPRTCKLILGTPPLYDDVVLPAHFDLSVSPGLGPFVLTPTTKDSAVVSVESDNAAHGDRAHVPVTLLDLDTDEVLGGITIDFVVDCYEPVAPDILGAAWRVPAGDTYAGFNVIVSWGGVTTDVNDNPELVEHYEVQRHDGQAVPTWTTVAKVAIDDDPESPFFQFFDEVPPIETCPPTYRYRVRAVDRAGNAGAYSAEVSLPCAVVSVPPVEAQLEVGAFPNPFHDRTEIAYEVTQAGEVDVAIFDITGRQVRRLARGAMGPGVHRVAWDGTDEAGRVMPSGIYFYRVRGAAQSGMWKIIRSR